VGRTFLTYAWQSVVAESPGVVPEKPGSVHPGHDPLHVELMNVQMVPVHIQLQPPATQFVVVDPVVVEPVVPVVLEFVVLLVDVVDVLVVLLVELVDDVELVLVLVVVGVSESAAIVFPHHRRPHHTEPPENGDASR
jgi:hypothetical protein